MKIRSKTTGQVFEIPDEMAGNYNIEQPKPTSVYDENQPGDPVTKLLAKVQTYLGTSNILPGVLGGAGMLTGNPVAAGIGGGLGKGLQQYVGKSLNSETTTGGNFMGIPMPYGVKPAGNNFVEQAASYTKDLGGILKEGGKDAAIVMAFKALNAMLHPIQSLGKARAFISGQPSIPVNELNASTTKGLTEIMKGASGPQKVESTARLGEFVTDLGTSDVSGANVYKQLTNMDNEFVNQAIRDYMTSINPSSVNSLNKVMSLLYKLKPILPFAAGAGGVLGGLSWLGGKAKGLLSSGT